MKVRVRLTGNDWSVAEQTAVMENGMLYAVASSKLLMVREVLVVVNVLVVPFNV